MSAQIKEALDVLVDDGSRVLYDWEREIARSALLAAQQEAADLAALDAFTAKTGKPWSLHVWRGDEAEAPAFGVHIGNSGHDWSDGCLLYSATHTPTLARHMAAEWCRAEMAK